VALLLLGHVLRDEVPEATRWIRYARRFVEKEVLAQYARDGVHFEKSTAYHRLVTQLFLVAFIALERSGVAVGAEAKQRLHQACRYTRAYTRPDGMAPIWGDSDDARATWFDVRHHRDHRVLTDLAAAYFDDGSLAASGACAIDVPLFLGSVGSHQQEDGSSQSSVETRKWVAGVKRSEPPESYTWGLSTRSSWFDPSRPRESVRSRENGPAVEAPFDLVECFHDGGVVCATIGKHHFVADVGEVGLDGLGGHGHLDALSFELTLHGIPLIVDPGSYVYTGDPDARNRFRSTRAHNVVMVDGEEMADLFPQKLWRLGSEANPYDVCWQQDEDGFRLSARHDGYVRLPDAVHYHREFKFSAVEPRLMVSDRFQATGQHYVERFLHFNAGLELVPDEQCLLITARQNRCFVVTWDEDTEATLIDDWVSTTYGERAKSRTLVLRNTIHGKSVLAFAIACAGKQRREDFEQTGVDASGLCP
jgi:hypothetical protein